MLKTPKLYVGLGVGVIVGVILGVIVFVGVFVGVCVKPKVCVGVGVVVLVGTGVSGNTTSSIIVKESIAAELNVPVIGQIVFI